MSTSDPAQAVKVARPTRAAWGAKVDPRFAKLVVLVNGLVPALLLLIDALGGDLGANGVNFAIRTTGLVGIVLLTMTLAVTPLRKLTGWAWLIAPRRTLGVLSFTYLAAHFLIFFGWDREASVTSTFEEIGDRVYLLIGFIALMMLLALAITSTDGMVLRVGAKRWKWLHRLVYVIAPLAVLHFWLQVKSDIRAPRAFAIILGALLLYRVVRHYLELRAAAKGHVGAAAMAAAAAKAARPKRFWKGELRVARVFDETHDTRTFRFVAPAGGRLPFEHQPGQYLNLALTIDGKRVNRSYTIASSAARPESCEITVKKVGVASRWLHENLKEGDTLQVSAPAGKFVFGGEGERVVLVGGGVGVTPIMSVLRALTDRSWRGRIDVVLAYRTKADIIFEHELAHITARHPNVHVTITLSQPKADDAWAGERGHVSKELFARVVPDIARAPLIMLCGPDPMMVAVRQMLVEMGVPNERVATEAFVSPQGSEPSGPMTGEEMEQAAGVVAVRFARSDKSAESSGETVLECAEDAGVAIPFECRSGICGQCKTKLVSGRVAMGVQDALSASDKAKGLVLACQARPVRDVVIDA